MDQKKQMSLKEAGQHDMKLAGKLTGWGVVCKNRTGPTSKSQVRKANRKKK